MLVSALFGTSGYTFVAIAGANNCIQTKLISTFPEATFKANNARATPFNIATVPATCGYTVTGACNFYDAFGFSGAGQALTINVSIPHVRQVFTLMNACAPPTATQIAAIEFVGKGGAVNAFDCEIPRLARVRAGLETSIRAPLAITGSTSRCSLSVPSSLPRNWSR